MKIYACSDLHVSPTHFSDPARAFLEEAVREADLTLFCGDIYEGSWCSLKESVKSEKGRELWDLIKRQRQPVILRGNHDWTLQKYVVDPNVPVLDHWEFEEDGEKYYATHGWAEYDLPFGLLAPVYNRILPKLPILAKWWTRWRSPGTQKRKQRFTWYWRRVREMSNKAIFHCMKMSNEAISRDIKKRRIPIWGHSHHRHIDSYENWLAINCGDFCEDDIGGIVIEDGVAREW
jgi:UDP-2,3-diacylglucosamine pyrophosphatase LpxH